MNEQTIFTAVLELEPGARTAFLDGACASNPPLRERIERLLQIHASAGERLNGLSGSTGVTLDLPTVVQPDTRIGPYKIREQIGEGGMGEVYVAEQTEPVRRKVALKIIRPGMATRDVVARFEAERQALAMMDHPNIAKVFDAGTTGEGVRCRVSGVGDNAAWSSLTPDTRNLTPNVGQPYFVMELVQGPPITEYCDEHRLSTTERLKLFATVCRAVQHAHQKGIIHRDLKPSNVLVPEIDGTAVPKVIDFGVAKAVNQKLTKETVYTHFAQVVGTPLYMSPEQAGLGVVDIDTRSDVYSLGVLLYELLTGQTPFDSQTLKQAGFDEMQRIIREIEPRRPSAMVSTLDAAALSTVADRRGSDPRRLPQSLAGELDWIVMKCLEKDRNRRYESASALAADIERYLAGEVVEASPPSAIYRFKKFATRNKAVLATTALVLAALLLGVAGTSWQAWRATRERQNALENFRRARDTVDTFLTTVEKNELLQNPEMQPLRRELLDKARRYYQEFIDDRRSHPELQQDMAEAYLRIGDIGWALGQDADAREADSKAVEIRKKLAAANPTDPEHQHNLAATYLAISDIPHHWQADNLRKAIETAKALPEESTHRHMLAKAYLQLGGAILDKFQARSLSPQALREAAGAVEQAEKLFEELQQQQPEVADYRLGLGELYFLVARYRAIKGDSTEANDYKQRAFAVLKKLVDDYPDNAEYRWKLVEAYGSGEEAEKAFEILSSLLEQYPTVVRYQERLVGLYMALADSRKDALERAVEIANDLVERYPEHVLHRANLATCHAALGESQLKEDKFEQAILSFQAAITHYTATKPHAIGNLSDAYASLSEAYQAAGNVEEALAAAKNALEAVVEIVKTHPQDPWWVAGRSHAMLRVGSLLQRGGKLEEALAESQRAAELQEKAFNDARLSDSTGEYIIRYHAALVRCYQDIAQYQETLGRHAEAVSAYRKALAAQAQMIRDFPDAWWYNSPNRLYDGYMTATHGSGNRSEAEPFLREEVATWRELSKISKMKESCQIRELELQLRLAEWLEELNRHEEASTCYRDASALLDELSAAEPEWVAKAIATCIHVCPTRLESDRPPDGYQSEYWEAIDQQLASAFSVARGETEGYPADGAGWRWNAWSELALCYYRWLEWKGADADGRLSIKLAPHEPEKLQMLAPLLLLAGSIEEYQTLCKRLLAEEPKFWNHDHLKKILALCLLDPQPADPETLLRLARQAAVGTPADHLLSVAYYRAGNSQQAIEGLLSALKQASHEEPIIELHLALAHHLAGHQEQASAWLEKGKRGRSFVWAPATRLTYEVLRQQAEELIAETHPATAHE